MPARSKSKAPSTRQGKIWRRPRQRRTRASIKLCIRQMAQRSRRSRKVLEKRFAWLTRPPRRWPAPPCRCSGSQTRPRRSRILPSRMATWHLPKRRCSRRTPPARRSSPPVGGYHTPGDYSVQDCEEKRSLPATPNRTGSTRIISLPAKKRITSPRRRDTPATRVTSERPAGSSASTTVRCEWCCFRAGRGPLRSRV